MTHPEILKRITMRPDIFAGKPIIRDMRISVELLLSLLAQGVKPEAILADYPELEEADLQAYVAYAHAVKQLWLVADVELGKRCLRARGETPWPRRVLLCQ